MSTLYSFNYDQVQEVRTANLYFQAMSHLFPEDLPDLLVIKKASVS